MTNEPAPATPEEKMDWGSLVRDLVKATLMVLIALPLFISTLPWFVPFVQSYSDSYYEETMAEGGNPLAANGEAAIGELMLFGTNLTVCAGIAALIVFAFMRTFWRKKPAGPVRDIIRVRGW